ncbi:MAG: DUF4867 family protein [Bacilli bacterium]|nr:DUF4867 family protein [Bacilli bacterium]
MKIYSVYDPEFKEYGSILGGDWSELVKIIATKECPEGTVYVPSDADLEAAKAAESMSKDIYGDMPIQLGYCNGHNKMLNCLEYHRDSEVNLSNDEFILMLAKRSEIIDGKLDTSVVKAFHVPAGVAVEVWATTLHYAPCGVDGKGFRVIVVLPKGTNVSDARSKIEPALWATNKWLLAHKDTNEAKNGAYVGLVGENLSL